LAVLHFALRDATETGVLRAAGIGSALFAAATFFEEFKVVKHEIFGNSIMYVIVPFAAIAVVFFVWSMKQQRGRKRQVSVDANSGLSLAAVLFFAFGAINIGASLGVLPFLSTEAKFASQMIGIYSIYLGLLSYTLSSSADATLSFFIGLTSTVLGLLQFATRKNPIVLAVAAAQLGVGLQSLAAYLSFSGKEKKRE